VHGEFTICGSMNYREALPKSHMGRVDLLGEPRWVGQACMRIEGAYSFNYTVRLVDEYSEMVSSSNMVDLSRRDARQRHSSG
jgi:hypothetical protein